MSFIHIFSRLSIHLTFKCTSVFTSASNPVLVINTAVEIAENTAATYLKVITLIVSVAFWHFTKAFNQEEASFILQLT